jgi:hypothetical protein
MYLLLLLFGGLLTAAGIVLAASGVSIHDRTFDATIVTPGVVAAVGGLLLIALGLALRVLQRIEKALAFRSALPAMQLDQPAEPSLAAAPVEAAQIPLPTVKVAPRPPAASAAPQAPAAETEVSTETVPVVAVLETTRVVEETEVLLSPKPTPPIPTAVDKAVPEVDQPRAARRSNGAAPIEIAPRPDNSARSPVASERARAPAFDSLWPKGPRPARSAQPGAGQAVVSPVVESEQNNEPLVDVPQTVAPVAVAEQVSVLKSGVVDGMAYTLYSDGSIEAQLPQGTLRFGSITELRNHIEQSA